MCHAERQEVYAWIAGHGGTADTPRCSRDKVRAARAWRARIGPDNRPRTGPMHGPKALYGGAMTTATIDSEARHRIPTRLDVDAAVPAFSKAMAHLDTTATRELDRVDFPAGLRDLLRLRASQINGCAYCVDTHSTDAADGGGEHSSGSTPWPCWARGAVLHRQASAPRSRSPSR